MDLLELKGLKIDCVVGFGRHERTKTQKLLVDVGFYFDARGAARSADITETIDYVWALGDTRFLLEECQFLLIESAAEMIATYLLSASKVKGTKAELTALALKVSKPEVVIHGASPTLHIRREASEIRVDSVEQSFGRIDTIYSGKECSFERVVLKPGKKIFLQSSNTDERDMIVGDCLFVQGRETRLGNVFRWPKGTSRLYENRTASEQSFLCVSRPALQVVNRIETQSREDGLAWTEPEDYYLGLPGLYVTT